MTLTTSTITGRVPLPTDENLQFAELTFALSGLDTEGANVLPGGVSTRAVLVGSDIPAGFELWQNTAGLRGTHYRVLARWTVKDSDGIRDQYADLGIVQVGADASYTLAALLNYAVPSAPASFWSSITQAEYDAVMQARDDAAASAVAADASAEILSSLIPKINLSSTAVAMLDDHAEGRVSPKDFAPVAGKVILGNPNGCYDNPRFMGAEETRAAIGVSQAKRAVASFFADSKAASVTVYNAAGATFYLAETTGTINHVDDDGIVTKWALSGPAIFENRAQAMAFIAAIDGVNGSTFAVGDQIGWDGLLIEYDGVSTYIDDMTGWVPDGTITPWHFGIAGDATTDDIDALEAMGAYLKTTGNTPKTVDWLGAICAISRQWVCDTFSNTVMVNGGLKAIGVPTDWDETNLDTIAFFALRERVTAAGKIWLMRKSLVLMRSCSTVWQDFDFDGGGVAAGLGVAESGTNTIVRCYVHGYQSYGAYQAKQEGRIEFHGGMIKQVPAGSAYLGDRTAYGFVYRNIDTKIYGLTISFNHAPLLTDGGTLFLRGCDFFNGVGKQVVIMGNVDEVADLAAAAPSPDVEDVWELRHSSLDPADWTYVVWDGSAWVADPDVETPTANAVLWEHWSNVTILASDCRLGNGKLRIWGSGITLQNCKVGYTATSNIDNWIDLIATEPDQELTGKITLKDSQLPRKFWDGSLQWFKFYADTAIDPLASWDASVPIAAVEAFYGNASVNPVDHVMTSLADNADVLTLRSFTAYGARLKLRDAATVAGLEPAIEGRSEELVGRAGGSRRWRTNNTEFYPDVDAGLNLGTSVKRFGYVYANRARLKGSTALGPQNYSATTDMNSHDLAHRVGNQTDGSSAILAKTLFMNNASGSDVEKAAYGVLADGTFVYSVGGVEVFRVEPDGVVTNASAASMVVFQKLPANRALTATTDVQQMFAAGAVTVRPGVYEFRASIICSGMSATTGNLGFTALGAGTAILGSYHLQTSGNDSGAYGTNGALSGRAIDSPSTTNNISSSGTGTTYQGIILGTLEVTAEGTLIPSIALSDASSATLVAGSSFTMRRLGASTMIGPWS